MPNSVTQIQASSTLTFSSYKSLDANAKEMFPTGIEMRKSEKEKEVWRVRGLEVWQIGTRNPYSPSSPKQSVDFWWKQIYTWVRVYKLMGEIRCKEKRSLEA